MKELIIRTEELDSNQIKKFYVESEGDRERIEYLKSKTPIILVGSRGIGKTFLMKVAEQELLESFNEDRILPVFLTFRRASLITTKNSDKFQSWMLARICSVVMRAFTNLGKLNSIARSISKLTGEDSIASGETKIERVAIEYEESYKKPDSEIDDSAIPSIDDFLDAIEDLCIETGVKRIVLFIDEAAHALYADQQRQFFTLFRDLRSPYITCNASVYPGVTSYGNTFQPSHDATIIATNRNIEDENYIQQMKDIVLKQIDDSATRAELTKNGQNFTLLAYAASGNPRTLLKTISIAKKLDSKNTNQIFREYFKTTIWAEHTSLGGNYPSYLELVDWGRDFIEKVVLQEIKEKNDNYVKMEKPCSLYFWVDKNVTQIVQEALRLLEYTGLIYEHAKGIRATRDGVGTRYMVNVGCLLSYEATPASSGPKILKRTTIKRFTEFSATYQAFIDLENAVPNFIELSNSEVLKIQLSQDIEKLDLTEWQKERIYELGIQTIGELLNVPEAKLMEARYVGNVRSRNIKNAAFAAVFEYLLG